MTFKFWKGKEFKKCLQSFGTNFVESSKELWKGEGKGLSKHAGKALIGIASLSTILGVINAVSHKSPNTKNVIDKNERYVVD
jgi:hypothetical protein